MSTKSPRSEDNSPTHMGWFPVVALLVVAAGTGAGAGIRSTSSTYAVAWLVASALVAAGGAYWGVVAPIIRHRVERGEGGAAADP